MKTHTAKIYNFYHEVWHQHIKVPMEAVEPFLDMKAKRVICTLFGETRFHCALMPDGKGGFFINLNKELRKKYNLDIGDEVSFTLERDESQYGMEMPEELGELLAQDDEGSALFHALTPGKQRSLIFLVAKPKTSHTRLRKALGIINYLKSAGGQLDYKELHAFLKVQR